MTQAIADTDDLTLRAAGPDDEAFLAAVYASTRADELAAVPWSAHHRRAFLAMQHRAQHTDYHTRFPDASYDIILLGTAPVGRLYVHRSAEEHRVVDIALLPDFRGRGIGRSLLDRVLADADVAAVPVRLHVDSGNPAAVLYRRLGFTDRPAADGDIGSEVYHELEWWPPTSRGATP